MKKTIAIVTIGLAIASLAACSKAEDVEKLGETVTAPSYLKPTLEELAQFNNGYYKGVESLRVDGKDYNANALYPDKGSFQFTFTKNGTLTVANLPNLTGPQKVRVTDGELMGELKAFTEIGSIPEVLALEAAWKEFLQTGANIKLTDKEIGFESKTKDTSVVYSLSKIAGSDPLLTPNRPKS